MMTIDELIETVIRDGQKSWLVVKATRYDFNPPRNENGHPLVMCSKDVKVPMDRFAFQVDGSTTWDAIIFSDGLKILYNRCQWQKHYLEDDAFRGKEFNPGNIVDFDTVKRAVREFVRLSNVRLNNDYETIFED